MTDQQQENQTIYRSLLALTNEIERQGAAIQLLQQSNKDIVQRLHKLESKESDE